MSFRMNFLARMVFMTLLGSLGGTGSAQAARLVRLTVEVNGQTVLESHYTDDGLEDAATVWSYFRTTSLKAEAKAKLPVEPSDALSMKLQGNVVVKAVHAGRTIAEAKLTELSLNRRDGASTEWSLTPEEVERTARAAGLTVQAASPVAETKPWQNWLRILSFIILLLIGVSLVAQTRKRREKGNPSQPLS